MITRTHVAAAAPLWVRNRLAGPVRRATVIHAGTHAIYVAVDDEPHCIGVVSRSASSVPCVMQIAAPDVTLLLEGVPADGQVPASEFGGRVPVRDEQVYRDLSDEPNGHAEVIVGEGLFRIGTIDISVGRTVDVAVPTIDRNEAGSMAALLREILADRLSGVLAELPARSLELLAQADSRAVPMMLGRGSGLTPLGDDVLSGWLATLHAAGVSAAPVLQSVVDLAQSGTTLLSATLLDRAAAGQVLPEFRRLLLDLGSHRARVQELRNDVDLMLSIGHTSGAGMLLGSLLALDHLTI